MSTLLFLVSPFYSLILKHATCYKVGCATLETLIKKTYNFFFCLADILADVCVFLPSIILHKVSHSCLGVQLP